MRGIIARELTAELIAVNVLRCSERLQHPDPATRSHGDGPPRDSGTGLRTWASVRQSLAMNPDTVNSAQPQNGKQIRLTTLASCAG